MNDNTIPVSKDITQVGYNSKTDRFYIKFNANDLIYELSMSELDSFLFIKAFANMVYKVAYLKRTGKVIKEDIKITEIDIANND